jgi:hypothetical protein
LFEFLGRLFRSPATIIEVGGVKIIVPAGKSLKLRQRSFRSRPVAGNARTTFTARPVTGNARPTFRGPVTGKAA